MIRRTDTVNVEPGRKCIERGNPGRELEWEFKVTAQHRAQSARFQPESAVRNTVTKKNQDYYACPPRS